MKQGALLFAFDGEIEYTRLAIACARNIKQHLDIPVTLVTDQVKTFPGFNNQILVDSQESKNRRYWADTDSSTSWLNHSRSKSFELSPYERTLVIDVDYIIKNPNLLTLLKSQQNFLAHRSVYSVNEARPRYQTFGTKATDLWWATVLVFDKSEFCKDLFDVWQMVENNYQYYANFFGFSQRQFRNDYALSIALLLCSGNTVNTNCEIPWPLFNVDTEVAYKGDSVYYAKMENGKKVHKRITVNHADLHVMGKSYLND